MTAGTISATKRVTAATQCRQTEPVPSPSSVAELRTALTHHTPGHAAERLPVAALFVARDGCYFNLPGIDPWDLARDARTYDGPWPVVAHPPCQRWGRYWGGSPRKPHQYELGADDGCFAAALAVVRRFGGVLEHPESSHAWRAFGLAAPPRDGGWVAADFDGGWTCCVEQGHYGHIARKATWLYACNVELPSLRWGRSAQRIHPVALARYGYEKARRIGVMAMIGGKNKTLLREATPPDFRDALISIARTAFDRALGFALPSGVISPENAKEPGALTSRRRASALASRDHRCPDVPQGSVVAHASNLNPERDHV